MRLGIGMLATLALLGCANNDAPTPTGTTTTPHTDVTGSWTLTWGPMTGNFTVHDTTGRRHDTTFDTVTVTPLKVDTIVDSSFIIVNRLVGDTCHATGTLVLKQGIGIDTFINTTRTPPDTVIDTVKTPGDVRGLYSIARTCNDTLVFPDSVGGRDTIPAGQLWTHTDGAFKSLVTAGNVFYVFLDNNPTPHTPFDTTFDTVTVTPLKVDTIVKVVTARVTRFNQGQQATVSGNSMTGVAVWANIKFTHSPKDLTFDTVSTTPLVVDTIAPARTVPLTGTFSATRP